MDSTAREQNRASGAPSRPQDAGGHGPQHPQVLPCSLQDQGQQRTLGVPIVGSLQARHVQGSLRSSDDLGSRDPPSHPPGYCPHTARASHLPGKGLGSEVPGAGSPARRPEQRSRGRQPQGKEMASQPLTEAPGRFRDRAASLPGCPGRAKPPQAHPQLTLHSEAPGGSGAGDPPSDPWGKNEKPVLRS